MLTFQKAIGIGVEIGTRCIKIAKINRISDKSFELLDYDTIDVEQADKTDTPHLAKALSSIFIGLFCLFKIVISKLNNFCFCM